MDTATDSSHSSKRFRSESGSGVRTGNGDHSENFNHKVPPSPVVHVRNLPDHATDDDLHEAVMSFGNISFITRIPNRNMALIEFESVDSAVSLVTYAQSNTMFVGSKPALFNYSTSTRIKRPADSLAPNCVVLLTILNARHPITVEVIHAIAHPFGNVLRIVVFRKNGVQAMVEYDSLDSAAKAKQALNGQDIYSDCCTVKTEFAKPTTLNVRRNDADTWDFTVGIPPVKEPMKNQPLLADPRYGLSPSPFGPMYGGMPFNPAAMGYGVPGAGFTGSFGPMGGGGFNPPFMAGGGSAYYSGDGGRQQSSVAQPSAASGSYQQQQPQQQQHYDRRDHHDSYEMPTQHPSSYPSPAALLSAYESQTVANTSGGNPDCVLMIYGMEPSKFNCQRLFNLLCVYGTVIRIKFLKKMETSAMVQMGDRESCDRVIRNLNNASCFGSKFSIGMSKQSYLQDVVSPHALPDGSSAYADFVGSKNQRYNCADAVAKNRPVQPTSTLYFYNAPPNITEDELMQAVTETGAIPPTKICIFPPKSEKSSRGLMQWSRIESCTDALVLANHVQLYGASHTKAPFVLKLSFSQSSVD